MRVSIAQFKSALGAADENFSTAARLIEAAQPCDVIVLPELWSTGYYPTPVENFADDVGHRTIDFICAAAKKFSVNIVGGSVIVNDGGKIFNRCHVANRSGQIVAAYDKTHLFGFAGEDDVFSAGNELTTFELDGVICGAAICYDLRFPETIRRLALGGAEIIFVPAAWSLKRLRPRQILTKARAIENQLFVVFANSAGISEVVDPRGEVIIEGGRDTGILTAEINFDVRRDVRAAMNLLADRNFSVDTISN
ncbi:MAG: carbon-nitrogen family hydrolase [Quinella sp. 2Q5]|nr:carbon-nitrogen family hydrolase [Quinella sp. 2Q5]